ncbi:hypothetical protein ACGF3G_04975 [Streptomyces sp. NPDC048179]|uniref:hypothetical protein n=1 Tax=Streptomyces sp. NPDC048179 TaxID=3365506 RepID=UPI0037171C32
MKPRPRTVADIATTDYDVAAAPDQRATYDGRLVVLVDDQGEPVGLAGPDGPGPAVALPGDTALTTALYCEEVLEILLDGAAGLVVVDSAGQLAGVVPIEAVRLELAAEMAAPHELGDSDLPGRRTGLPPPIRLRCDVCQQTNRFVRFRHTETYRCQYGGHDFVPAYGPFRRRR